MRAGHPSSLFRERLVSIEQQAARADRRSRVGFWSTYSPALTSTGVQPNIGTTGAGLGRYLRVGDDVTAWGSITFGGAGIAAGTGNYQISVPFPRTASNVGTNLIGASIALFNGAATWGFFTGAIMAASASVFTISYPATWPIGALTTVGAAVPWAWNAASMLIAWMVDYEASPY